MTERWRCPRCNVSYRVELPHRNGRRAEWARCPEPECGLGFWHAHRENTGNILVGIDPASLNVEYPS